MFGFEFLLANVLSSFSQELFGQIMQVTFIQNLIKGLLGADLPVNFNAQTFSAFAWVHPVILFLLWSQTITFCTRTPAGEIDRGTIDVLLSLPVSRMQLLFSETLVWLSSGAIMIALGLLGFWIGNFTITCIMHSSAIRPLIVF